MKIILRLLNWLKNLIYFLVITYLGLELLPYAVLTGSLVE
ncbi:hypothetical protein SAMN05443246_4087 [Paenibacillus sp. GP183]|nr:hypothetical protein SAMN05443246_4087 [Paenibacillus sp. GP183]